MGGPRYRQPPLVDHVRVTCHLAVWTSSGAAPFSWRGRVHAHEHVWLEPSLVGKGIAGTH